MFNESEKKAPVYEKNQLWFSVSFNLSFIMIAKQHIVKVQEGWYKKGIKIFFLEIGFFIFYYLSFNSKAYRAYRET